MKIHCKFCNSKLRLIYASTIRYICSSECNVIYEILNNELLGYSICHEYNNNTFTLKIFFYNDQSYIKYDEKISDNTIKTNYISISNDIALTITPNNFHKKLLTILTFY